jgi:hypothetical protein
MKFLNNLDLNGNQLLSPVIHVSSQSTITNGPAGDTSGTEGQIFYNSHSNGKALFFRDDSGWRPIGDISGVTAGAGLSGGGTGGTVSLAIDLSEFSDVTPANGDKILTLDSDGSTEQLTTIASLATLFAGSGLTATNSVIAVDTLNQDTTGTADHVTIVDNESTDEENQITFIEGAAGAGSRGLEADGDFTYNPSSGTVTATIFKGNIDAVDGDFDGTLEADAITVGGTNIVSGSVITTLGTITQSEVSLATDTLEVASANANDPLVIIKNTTNDANGARLRFVKDKGAAGADGDDVGIIEFVGDDAAQTQTTFGKILVEVGEADNTDEAGTMTFQVAASDGTTTGLRSGLVLTGHKTSQYVDVTLGTGSASTVTIPGNLTVSGTTTTVNSTTVNLNDHNIILDSGNSTSAVVDGAGITIEGGSGDDAKINYSTTGPKFELLLGSSYEDLQVDQLIAASLDISGDVDVDGTLETDALSINGTAVTSTAAELNLLDGITTLSGSNTGDEPDASTSVKGIVELATSAETITGTDTARAVTPDGLAARSVVATIAQSSLTDDNIVTITHNLGTADVIVQLFDMSTEATVFADVYRTAADLSTASTSVISIDFGTAPANDIRCLITSLAGATASGTIAYT